MAIQFLLGPSGSGKSTYIYNRIIEESIKNPKELYYLIVPEQYTLEAQRDIVTRHPNGGTMNIDAIGFNRLAYRVFDELGICPGSVLEDFGKSMLIKKIMWEHKAELDIYGSCVDKMGFIDEMKSMISELFQYTVDEAALENLKETLDTESMLYKKLKDLELIYSEFQAFTGKSYIVAEQLTQLLAAHIAESDIIKNSTFFIDGFTGFTPVQMKLIKELAVYSRNIYFSFTIDTDEVDISSIKEHELFYLSKETIRQISEIAAKSHIALAEPVLFKGEPYRFQNAGDLGWLQKNIFRYPYKKYKGVPEHIHLTGADNAKSEIHYIASTIRQLVAEEEYRYRDIAVVTGDLSATSDYFLNIMKEYDIPVFVDENEELKNNPSSEAIRSLLKMYADNYSYESVFSFLKSGMTDISEDKIEKFENYILKRGLRGREAYRREFLSSGGFYQQDKESELLELENTRREFVELLRDIDEILTNKENTVREYIEGIDEFLNRLNVYERLLQRREELYALDRFAEGDVYVQIYDKLTALFDKIIELIGDEHMDMAELYEVVDAGLSEIEIGIVPPTIDRVVVGDITRTRLNHIKVLFFAGVNDGIIPASPKRGRILNDVDRQTLTEAGINLAPSDKQNTYIEQFYLYINITKPGDRLYISYRKTDGTGGSLRPSYIVKRINNIFPELKTLEFDMKNVCLYTREGLLRGYLRSIEENDKALEMTLEDILREMDDSRLKVICDGRNYINQESLISRDIIRLLYGDEMALSVSRLETFAKCRFAYFLKYGLGLMERQIHKIDIRNVGSILHQVMEQVFKTVRDNYHNAWEKIDKNTINQLVSEALELAAKENVGDYFEEQYRSRYMLSMIEQMAKRSVYTMQKQILNGSMRPAMIEKRFDSEADKLDDFIFNLDGNMKMRIVGKIDRVDVDESEGDVFIQVVDYKSSSKKLDMDLIEAGVQLQLITYFSVAYEIEKQIYPDKNIRPAGLLYYTFNDPVVETTGKPQEEKEGFRLYADDDIEDKRLELLKLNGFVNSDKDIIKRMDKDFKHLSPVSGDKDGNIRKNKGVISEEKLLDLMNLAKENIQKLGDEIAAGDVTISPFTQKGENPCQYCDYKYICRYDEKVDTKSLKGELI